MTDKPNPAEAAAEEITCKFCHAEGPYDDVLDDFRAMRKTVAAIIEKHYAEREEYHQRQYRGLDTRRIREVATHCAESDRDKKAFTDVIDHLDKESVNREAALTKLIEASESMFSGMKELYRMFGEIRYHAVFTDDKIWDIWQRAIDAAKETR